MSSAADLSAAADTRSVRERLMDSAERLFAQHGWHAVGIRTIAADAQVSLAALNYHFGSKEKLLGEIFAARARLIVEERERLLDAIMIAGKPSLDKIIEAFLRPALTLGSQSRLGGTVFVKLRARLAMESEAFSRGMMSAAFDGSARLYIGALGKLLPELAPEELFWRFHFLLGGMTYTMADSGRIQSISMGQCDPGDTEAALRQMVHYAAAGFGAPSLAKPAKKKKKKER